LLAKASGKIREGWDSASSVLNFEKNPKRRLMILGVGALAIVAIVLFVIGSIATASGCNAVLSAQRYGCIESLAGQTGNVLYCNRIGSPGIRSSCIMSVAEAGKNTSECTAFPIGQYRTDCIENISYSTSNPVACNGLDQPNQSLCGYNVMAKLNFSGPSYCAGITEQSYRNLCTSQSYYHLAIATRNYSYCSNLPAAQNETLVYAMTRQEPNSQNISSSYLTSFLNITPRDLCYSSIAGSGSNASCAYIANSTLRNACNGSSSSYNSTATVQNLTASCGNAPSKQLQNLCYFGIYANQAVNTNNESWCGLITNQSYMQNCIVNLATSSQNATYCNSLPNANDTQSCVLETQLSANYT
jgi:hypothetical protein